MAESSWKKKEEVMAFTGGKVCIFGGFGTGKSTVGGTFPNIDLVDGEAGQAFYLEENKNIRNVLNTTSSTEVQQALNELNDPEMLEDFDTILIDSGTKVYENMQAAAYEVAENRAEKQKQKGKSIDLEDLNLAQRDWGHIKRWNQQLTTAYILFSNLGKWTVVTAHLKDIEKEIKLENGESKRIKIGERPDLPKKAEHDFDIVLKTFIMENGKEVIADNVQDWNKVTYHARVLKDRTHVTQVGQILTNPSFETWRAKWEGTRKFGTKNVDMSKNVSNDKARFEIEQAEEDDIVERFKELIKKSTQTDKTEILKKVKGAKIENPLKPKTAEEIQFLSELLEEYPA